MTCTQPIIQIGTLAKIKTDEQFTVIPNDIV